MKKISAKQRKINELYAKERRRIQRFIKRAEKRNFEFEIGTLPAIPKRKTMGSVRRLQRLTADKLYQKASFIDVDTGEMLSGQQGRNKENRERSLKSAQTVKSQKVKSQKSKVPKEKKTKDSAPSWSDIIISNYKSRCNQFDKAGDIFKDWIEQLIKDNGKEAVAKMLEDGANAGLILTYKEAYDETQAKDYMASMLDYLPEAGEMYKSQIEELVSEWQFYSEAGDKI